MLIFSTVHGSHLYGLAHPGSDRDRFEVHDDDRPMRQRTDGTDDVTTVGWRTFIAYAQSGSHQSVEALYSRVKVYGRAEFRPFFEAMTVRGVEVEAKFHRTIKKFAHADDFKRRRHAVRLAFLLHDIGSDKRPDPTLTPARAHACGYLASSWAGPGLYDACRRIIHRGVAPAPLHAVPGLSGRCLSYLEGKT